LKPQELQTAINNKIMHGGDVSLAAALMSTRQEKSPEVTLKSPREVREGPLKWNQTQKKW
jgi:hypothetical protein